MAAKERWANYRGTAFWSRIVKRGKRACWLWTGLASKPPKTNTGAYGVLSFDGRIERAHRVAYRLATGPIPEGKFVLHKCDNTLCCNPAHLYLGDHRRNMADMVERKRRKGLATGENNGRAKLTQTQAEMIRKIYARGDCSQDAIAARFGVSQFAVSAIIRNKRYVKTA